MVELPEWKQLKNGMIELVSKLQGKLSDDQIQFAESLIDAGEYAVCLEIICDLLYDDDIKISQESFLLIYHLSEKMHVSPERYELLLPLVE